MSFRDRFEDFIKRMFGATDGKLLKSLWTRVEQIGALEPELEKLSDDALRAKTDEFRERLAKGTKLDDLLVEAFACVRESSRRHLKTPGGVAMRHFDVQLIGGMVLHRGSIAEMTTGEGKTLVSTSAAYLNGLVGRGVHIVTVNDYLAQRDADWMRPVYEGLGMTVGAIQSNMGNEDRHAQYSCDITYGTNNEFGFDYLRDNMKIRPQDQVQRRRHYAIVDEVDSILVDEARTPLIISGPSESSTEEYYTADKVAQKLEKDTHFEVKEKEHSVIMTEAGIERAEQLVGVDSFYSPANMKWPHHVEQALRAHHLYQPEVHYVAKDGEIIIVDEFTGRLQEGRRWSDGLHQAVEAKEGLKIKEESQTLATITLQNFFRLYDKVSGMTGTAKTEEEEFQSIYGLDVVQIPTNKEMQRISESDVVYRTKNEKWKAIVEQIKVVHDERRPILVGTISIEDSELLSGMLTRRGVPHNVLNAKYHEREAEIVQDAGQQGAVTIATNMAGRGTDIVLGEGVKELGGLYVLGCERHESRRIDNQLRGRCGRQGDPGSSVFFLSLEDNLMRIFASERISGLLRRFGMAEGVDISHPMVNRAIERAQKKVETRNFEIRKNLLEYDAVMNEQRMIIYDMRDRVLRDVDLEALMLDFMQEIAALRVDGALSNLEEVKEGMDFLQAWLLDRYRIENDFADIDNSQPLRTQIDAVNERILEEYEKLLIAKRETLGEELFTRLLHFVLLTNMDDKWKDHLHAMDTLRHSISMRSYAQLDPKTEYKREGYELFAGMLEALKDDTTSLIARAELERREETEVDDEAAEQKASMSSSELERGQREHARRMQAGIRSSQKQGAGAGPIQPIRNAQAKVGRNDPCPCGSGKKFKKCHGQAEAS